MPVLLGTNITADTMSGSSRGGWDALLLPSSCLLDVMRYNEISLISESEVGVGSRRHFVQCGGGGQTDTVS